MNEWILGGMNGGAWPKTNRLVCETCGAMTKSHTGTNTTAHRKQLSTYLAVHTHTQFRDKGKTQNAKEEKNTEEYVNKLLMLSAFILLTLIARKIATESAKRARRAMRSSTANAQRA